MKHYVWRVPSEIEISELWQLNTVLCYSHLAFNQLEFNYVHTIRFHFYPLNSLYVHCHCAVLDVESNKYSTFSYQTSVEYHSDNELTAMQTISICLRREYEFAFLLFGFFLKALNANGKLESGSRGGKKIVKKARMYVFIIFM